MKKKYEEKRDFLRMAIDCLLSFSKRGESKQFEGHVVNLSSKGILFTSVEPFDAGDRLDLVLTPSKANTAPMEVVVEVSRAKFNDSVYELACEIIKFKKAD